jgi:hypothetical protein
MTPRRLASSAAALVLAAGCSRPAAVATAAEHAQGVIDLMGAKAEACGGAFEKASMAFSVETQGGFAPALIAANPNIGLDAGASDRCRAAIAAMPCDALRYPGIPGDCFLALVGQVAPGGACTSSAGFDCLDGTCEHPAGCGLPGTCQAAATLEQSCESVLCKAGYACDGLHCQAITIPVAPAGGACQTALCPDTQYCGASRTCLDRLADGATCSSIGSCLFASECVTGRCTPARRAGSPCLIGSTQCPGHQRCGPGGTCQPPSALGQPCAAAGGLDLSACAAGFCETSSGTLGTCRAFKPLGAGCTPGTLECGYHAECGPAGTCAANYCGW